MSFAVDEDHPGIHRRRALDPSLLPRLDRRGCQAVAALVGPYLAEIVRIELLCVFAVDSPFVADDVCAAA